MKFAGLLVMPTGLFLAVAALILFPDAGPRTAFVLSGLLVEALGLAVAVRGHMQPRPRESRGAASNGAGSPGAGRP